MPGDTKEPQSYGSEGDWVSGKTGQRTNNPKATPPAEQSDFYDGRQEELDTRSPQPAFLTDVRRETAKSGLAASRGAISRRGHS